MNEIVNKFLLAGDKFIPEMHIRQPGFTYSTCGPLTENNERIQKFQQTGDLRYIFQNELDKTSFQHDMAYGDFKYLSRRLASILRHKAFNITTNPEYDGYERGLAAMVYKFFDKKSSGGAVTCAWSENLTTQDKSAIEDKIMSNQHPSDLAHVAKFSSRTRQLAEELINQLFEHLKNVKYTMF